MYLCTYKTSDESFICEIYHNRAEVFLNGEAQKPEFCFENIGEIAEQYGIDPDSLILV